MYGEKKGKNKNSNCLSILRLRQVLNEQCYSNALERKGGGKGPDTIKAAVQVTELELINNGKIRGKFSQMH